MIVEIREIFLLPPIIKLAVNIPDVTPEEFKDIVIARLQEENSVFICYKTGNIIEAFVFCTVDKYQGKKAYVIQYAYSDPKSDYSVSSEVFARACQKAKHLNLKEIFMMTSRNPEPFIRKYKFAPFMTVLKRSV